MLRKTLLVLAATVAVAGLGFAQGKPDFSGTWKLNVTKSDFGPVPGPNAQTDVIEQSGQTLKIKVSAEGDQGKVQYTEVLTTDGREVAIPADAPGSHPAPEVTLQTIAASWDGSTLNVSQKLTYGNEPVTGVSHYTLSPDGKVLTIASDYQSGEGGASRTFVFEKQDPSMASAGSSSGATPNPPSGMAVAVDGGSASNASASSSAKPNLSGTWVLDNSKSDFGPMPAPSSRTDVITQNGSSIKIAISQSTEMGDMNFTINLVDDGKTVATWQIMGNDAKSTAHWDGNTLVVHTDSTIQDNAMQFESRYQLAPDGNNLTVNGHMSGPMGDADTKLIFNKKS
jgi:hypothetical protein